MRSDPASGSVADLHIVAVPERTDRLGRNQSEPTAFPRGFDIGGGVGRQQQAVSDEGSGSGFDPTDIVFTAAVAFFERGAGVAGSRALRSGAGKRDQ
jgi:hypothetical protein